MKKILIVSLVSFLLISVLLGFTFEKDGVIEDEILRIHIRANSNLVVDQEVKYIVKDALIDYLIPLLSDIETKDDVQKVVENNKLNLESVANNVLKEKGFNYSSNIKICNEEFPTRSYNGVTLESGFYDAVIVELGEARGNNWWCVIYPPICFTNYSKDYNGKVVYKSKIMEIIDKIFNGGKI